MAVTFAGFEAQKIFEPQWAIYNDLNLDRQRVGQNVTTAGGDRTVSVSIGSTRIKGVLCQVTAAVTRQANANGSANPRVDALIWRVDWGSKTATLQFKQGTPASNPQPPSLTQIVNDRWEEPIATVRVGPGQGAFLPEDVTEVPPAVGVPWENVGPRAFMRKVRTGSGTNNVGAGAVGKMQSWGIQRSFGLPFGEPFGTGTFTVPVTGLYLVEAMVRITRTNTNQTGAVFLQMRQGVSSTASSSGSVVRSYRRTMGTYMGGTATQSIQLVATVHLTTGNSGYSFTVENQTGHSITVQTQNARCWWSVMYFGPSVGSPEIGEPEEPGGGD